MIRINLLPEEYRKKARTPVKLLLCVATVVAVNGGLVAWWAWSAFGVQAEIDGEKSVLQMEMDGLTPQVSYYHSLEGEAKQYKSRETTLASITKSRISWTKKLDELVDVVNRGGDGQRHLVWFDDLQVAQSADARASSSGSLRANGHSGSDKFAQVANFLEDLESSPFESDFLPPAPPEGTQTLVDETLVPPVVWAFPMSLTLKSPEERAAKAPDDKPGDKSGDKLGDKPGDKAGKGAQEKGAAPAKDGDKSSTSPNGADKNPAPSRESGDPAQPPRSRPKTSDAPNAKNTGTGAGARQ